MKKSLSNILSIILPNKKTNLFTICIIILGIISGSIFLIIISDKDKSLVITRITEFISKINTNDINNIEALKNSLIENSIYVLLMFLLSASIVGIIINIFLTYLRGFIAGFTISSFILTYKYKGIIASLIYTFPTIIIKFIITLLISTYSFTFTILLIKSIFNKTNNILVKKYIKKYFLILGICLVLVIITSISEAFLFPSIIKLVIKFFI